ncbi:MAG: PHP-associated domain-containing protein [Candidatus Bathyarchaeia archaeon]
MGPPSVGESDSHHPQTVGDANTVIDVLNPSIEDVVRAIRSNSALYLGDLSSIIRRYRIGVRYLFQKFRDN